MVCLTATLERRVVEALICEEPARSIPGDNTRDLLDWSPRIVWYPRSPKSFNVESSREPRFRWPVLPRSYRLARSPRLSRARLWYSSKAHVGRGKGKGG